MNKTITKVIPLAGYCLHLEMGSGGKLELDFSGLLDNIRFFELKDKDVFDSVSVDECGKHIVFKNGLRFGANEIVNIALAPKEHN